MVKESLLVSCGEHLPNRRRHHPVEGSHHKMINVNEKQLYSGYQGSEAILTHIRRDIVPGPRRLIVGG